MRGGAPAGREVSLSHVHGKQMHNNARETIVQSNEKPGKRGAETRENYPVRLSAEREALLPFHE